jgi:hypothetical protein
MIARLILELDFKGSGHSWVACESEASEPSDLMMQVAKWELPGEMGFSVQELKHNVIAALLNVTWTALAVHSSPATPSGAGGV